MRLIIYPINIFILLAFNFGCSSLNHTDKEINRSISSAEAANQNECVQLLNKFLPEHIRADNLNYREAKTTFNYYNPATPKGAQLELIKDAEIEAKDLFSSFAAKEKDLATSGKFKLLIDPHEALMARVMLIRNAKKSIDLTYYIFQDSDVSKILISELTQALRRGVNIRLMIDGSGSIVASTNFFKEIQILTHTLGGKIYNENGKAIGIAKFEAIEINPVFNVRATIKSWYNKVLKLVTGKEVSADDFSIFHRSHDKILLVDADSIENSMAIVGGRNISNHYYKIGTQEEKESTYNDLDILIKNIAYTKSKDEKEIIRNVLLDHFNRLYFYSANKRFEDFIFKITRSKSAKILNQMRNTRNDLVRNNDTELATLLSKMESEDYLNSGFDSGYISFLDEIENLVRKNSLKNLTYVNENSVMKKMWTQIETAEKDILICSPYIYLTDKEIEKIANWLLANPERTFRLITNSTSTSDNLFAQSMVENFVMPKLLKTFQENGVNPKQFELLAYGNLNNKEFGGTVAQGKLHAKFWMIDNYAMSVGTSNFDPVSRLINSEIMANIFPTEGKQSVEALNNYYMSLKENSTNWNSPEFLESKYRPELKTKLMIQSFLAKTMEMFNILPQD